MGNAHVKPHPRPRNKKQVHWKAADRPSPPGKPHLITENEATPDLITIRWSKPIKDGGSPISGYLVEHRRTGSPHWVRATPLLVPFPELTVSGLEPGWRYQFRVSAENAVGISEPGELSEPITVTLQRSAITAPRFTQELQDAVALENEKIEFTVHFLGQPAPKVCWFKDGFEIFSSRRIRIMTEHDKSILTIHQCALADEGEIKCTATNRAGHISTKSKLLLEAPPAIRLPRQYEEGLLFEIGEMIRLKVSVAGRPTPLVFWSHDGESIQNNDRYEVEYSDKSSILKISEATRSDRGEYQIKAVNKLGEDHASFLVTVTDKPSPPGKARVVMTLGRSVTLSWQTPSDDGGCKIGNYIIEYYRLGWNVWLKAATSRQLTTMLGDLIEGSEYKFRVKAESPYGISEPSEETDVVFIPDPKRGITQPQQTRGRSQPRDILDDMSVPVAAKRKHKPRSQSSGRVEDKSESTIQNTIFNAGIPKRPERNKIKSPPKTPEVSPMPTRKDVDPNTINRNIFDRSSMARELSYGSPEIKVKKELDLGSYLLNYSSSEKSKSPSPVLPRQDTTESNNDQARSRSVSFSSQKSRSPSPVPVRAKSPRENHDHFTGSSEFMLVLYPDENKPGQAHISDLSFEIDGESVPPPISLSAPELGQEPPELLHTLRNFVSSTELLHERAMMRFYQAAEAEEAELERLRQAKEQKQHSNVDIPKIQINSLDDQNIVGLDRKNSLRRRLSAGGISQQQVLWAQRRQSLRTPKELAEVLPPNNLQKFKPVNQKEALVRQRSESEEKEEEEFEKVRKMQDKVSFNKKVIKVADMEKWSDDYEESTEEETESSEDERFWDERDVNPFNPGSEEDEEEIYHPPRDANEPFEILTKRKKLPDPNFIPKPILKKTEHDELIQKIDLGHLSTKERKKQRSHSPMPPDFLIRERSQSLVEQLFKSNKKASKKETKAKPRSFSLVPNKDTKFPSLDKIKEEEKVSPTHNVSALAEISGITAASVIIPKKLLEKQKDNEESKVVADHYGDIIQTVSKQRKESESMSPATSPERVYTVFESYDKPLEELLEMAEIVEIIQPKATPKPVLYSRSQITNPETMQDEEFTFSHHEPRNISTNTGRTSRTQSQSPGWRPRTNSLTKPPDKPKRKTSPSPMRKPRMKTPSPSPNAHRRKVTQSPVVDKSTQSPNYSGYRPLLREIMTQTSVGLETNSNFSSESRTSTPSGRQELIIQAEMKVKSTIDYITDLTMFLLACWLYVFNNELLAIPVLLVMIYRQLTGEIKKRIPKWISKRFTKKK